MEEKTTLIVLVRDELEAIRLLLPKIPFSSVDETIFIDGQSKDGTKELLEKKGHTIFVQKELGRGNAFIEALNYASNENLIFFSGDGNEDPEDIQKINYYLKQGYDLVIGGRFLLAGSRSDDSDDSFKIRKYGNILFSKLVHLFWRSNVCDSINGFRGMKKTAMKKMSLDAPKHEIEIQSTIRAAKLKLKVKEFPTRELKRLAGLRKSSAGTLTLGYSIGMCILKELFIGKKFEH